MSKFNEHYARAKALLEGAGKILVSGHLSPDGDSLGCMIALQRLLRNAGYDATASADHNAFGKLAFMEGAGEILPLRKLKKRRFDLLVVVDASGVDRLPPEVRPFAEKLPKLCIDHHATSDTSFADAAIIDPSASSAGEIVWRFAKWMEWPLDSVSAEALWVSIVINDIIYGTFSRKAIELKRIAWRSLHIWKNGKVAEVSLTRDDFRSVRGTKANAEDIIEIPRSVARNEIALFFYQIPDRTKETRCSIRTRGSYDATALAAKFGGGGHRKAAGCTIACSMNAAKRRMRAAVKEMLKSACRKTMRIQA